MLPSGPDTGKLNTYCVVSENVPRPGTTAKIGLGVGGKPQGCNPKPQVYEPIGVVIANAPLPASTKSEIWTDAMVAFVKKNDPSFVTAAFGKPVRPSCVKRTVRVWLLDEGIGPTSTNVKKSGLLVTGTPNAETSIDEKFGSLNMDIEALPVPEVLVAIKVAPSKICVAPEPSP